MQNPSTDSSKPACCDSNEKPVQAKTQQTATQAQKSVITPPEKPITPQPKAKSCCG